MAMTELDWAARGEMSGKYLTRRQTQTSRMAKLTLSPGFNSPPSWSPSPSSTTSAGMSVMDWLAGKSSFNFCFFRPARFSLAAVSAREMMDGGLDVGGVLGEEVAVHDVSQLHQEAWLGGQLFPGPLVVQQRGQSGQAGREVGE